MNPRQRDLFLWQWSQRRKLGLARVALRGALIGAAGGLVFALIMASGMNEAGPRGFPWLLDALRRGALLCAMSIPAFGWIGHIGASRVFNAHEQMYHAILDTGATVPTQEPVLKLADRGPAIAVAVACLILLGLIVAAFVFLG